MNSIPSPAPTSPGAVRRVLDLLGGRVSTPGVRRSLRGRRTGAGDPRRSSPPTWDRLGARGGDPLAAAHDLRARWARGVEGRAPADRAFLARLAGIVASPSASVGIFPDVALRLDRALRHGDPSSAEVCQLVARDPELARRTILQASSAAHGRMISELQPAITRIGLDGVWRLAMAVVLRAPLFRAPGYELAADAARQRALVAAELAAEVCPDPRERGVAFLAGLLHEVGTLTILRAAGASCSEGRPSPEVVTEMLGACATPMAVVMVSEWRDLDPRVVAGIADCGATVAGPASLVGRCARAGQIVAGLALGGREQGALDAIAALELAEDPEALLVRAIRLAASTVLG